MPEETDPIRPDLLGYLLGALDDEERAQIERQLEHSPRLRRELRDLEARLEPLASPGDEVDAPFDLAQRTCDFVFQGADEEKVVSASAWGHDNLIAGLGRWTLADAVVVAAVMIVAAGLFFPAIAASRFSAQRAICENNLRQLGYALAVYTDLSPDGRFPAVPESGNRSFVGIVGPTLVEMQLVDDPRIWLCPSSPLSANHATWKIPALTDIDRATGATLRQYQREGSGSYGYTLGVFENGKLRAPRDQSRPYFAVLADAPAIYLPERRSDNHAGQGQNVLFEDGHIRFLDGPLSFGDHPYLSRRGYVEPARDGFDSVIGGSFTTPLLPELMMSP